MPPLPGPILRACCSSRSLECRPEQKIVPGRSQLFPLQGILSSFDHRAFPGQGDARGAAPEQQTRREHAGTVSYSEYHPFAVRPGTGPDQRGYCIIRPGKSKGFFSGFFPAECTTFSPLFRQSPTKKKNRRAACPGKGRCANRRRSSVTVFPGAAGTGAWQNPSGPWRSRGAGTWGSGPPGAPGPGCPRP